jgi:hypothetical protein
MRIDISGKQSPNEVSIASSIGSSSRRRPPPTRAQNADAVAIDDALNAVADFDRREAKVVELRFLGGMKKRQRRFQESDFERCNGNGHQQKAVCIVRSKLEAANESGALEPNQENISFGPGA